MKIDLSNVSDLIKRILSVPAKFNGKEKTIEQWRKDYSDELKENNSKGDFEKFKIFVFNSLLIQNIRGEIGNKLKEAADKTIYSFKDVNRKNIERIFKQSGFWLTNRWNVPIDFNNKFFSKYKRNWKYYFDEARKYYRENFKTDGFLEIKGVGFKTRDLALSCFLKEYSANDFHVVDVLVRTGLIIEGYGDLGIGTNQNNDKNYLFLRRLIIKFSKQSGYSPGELDRIFWHFGRAVCKNKPDCDNCSIKNFCLTGKNRKKYLTTDY